MAQLTTLLIIECAKNVSNFCNVSFKLSFDNYAICYRDTL